MLMVRIRFTPSKNKKREEWFNLTKYKKVVTFLLFAIMLLISTQIHFADSRQYAITDYNIIVNINSDGSADIEEKITYNFDGEYNGVYLDLDFTGSKGLVEHSVVVKMFEGFRRFVNDNSENEGTYTYKVEGSTAKFIVYEPSAYGEKTFIYKYKLIDAVTKYNDIAEFNRKLVGTTWEVPVHNVKISITIPKGASKDEIKIFSHGPLTGESRFINELTSEYTVPVITPGDFFEVRVLFPTTLVPESQNVVNKDVLKEIMEQEAKLAEEANVAREKAREEVEHKKKLENIGKAMMAIVFPIWIWLLVKIRKKYGQDPKTNFDGKYYREIPGDYPPAEVNYLMGTSDASTKEILATLLDLARKGVLILSTEKKTTNKLIWKKESIDYVFTKKLQTIEVKLKSHEEHILFWLFNEIAKSDSFRFSDMKTYLDEYKNRNQFWKYFTHWKKLVRKEASKNRFYELPEKKGGFILTGLMLIVLGIATGRFMYAFAVLISLAGLLLILFLSAQHKRTEYGSDQYRKWIAFKRFVKDFSSIKDAQIPSVAIWEHYLVYAIPLGIAKEVIKQFPLIPDKEKDERLSGSAIACSILATDKGLSDLKAFDSAFNDLNTSFNSAFSIASSSNSSGSGSGGGSSGGSSGGGGGGSGGGAF